MLEWPWWCMLQWKGPGMYYHMSASVGIINPSINQYVPLYNLSLAWPASLISIISSNRPFYSINGSRNSVWPLGTSAIWSRVAMLCTIRVFHTIRVWYILHAYGTYHTHMVCFSVPYAYGCTVRVYVSHSIKHSIKNGGYIPKPCYSKASPKAMHVRYS